MDKKNQINEIQQKRYQAAVNLAKAVNELSELLPTNPFDALNFLGDLENVLTFDEKWVPNPEFIKSGKVGFSTFKNNITTKNK